VLLGGDCISKYVRGLVRYCEFLKFEVSCKTESTELPVTVIDTTWYGDIIWVHER